MKTHTTLGHDAIAHAECALGTPVPFLAVAKSIAMSHQEKWDGSGYPQGLAGDDIPIAARLMAVAVLYDALINSRVYKPGMPHVQALVIMMEGRDKHFDRDILDAFVDIQEEVQAIAQRYADSDQDLDIKREYLVLVGAV